MSVDSRGLIVVRDRESENLLVKFILTRYRSVQFNNSARCNAGTMSILSICDFKCFVAAFDLGSQEREVYVICGHKTRRGLSVTDVGMQLLELVACKCGRFESHKEVRLRVSTVEKRYEFESALIKIFD